MKKFLKSFIIVWVLGLAFFNLCTFLIPSETRFTPNFWVGYGFITVAFILQLGVTVFSLKGGRNEKIFLSVPTIKISFATLICTVIAGAVTMAVKGIPEWVGPVICFACAGVGIAVALLSKGAGDLVSEKEEKIKGRTLFVKALTADADILLAQAKEPAIREEVKKVYEAVRYSDPMSVEALAGAEAQIILKFNELQGVVAKNDTAAVQEIVKELLVLIKDRNNKCKLLK